MSSGTQQLSNRKYALFAVTFAVGVGILIGARRLIAPWEHLIQTVLGLAVVVLGLAMLSPLAAFGPKTKEQEASRVREAGLAVCQVLLGTSWLLSDSGFRAVVSVAAVLFLFASRVMSPRRAG